MFSFVLRIFVFAALIAACAAVPAVRSHPLDASSDAHRHEGPIDPEVSAILDLYYYDEDSSEGLDHILGELQGFGHADHEDEGHGHSDLEEGFNLRHVELRIDAEVDGYAKGSAIVAVDAEGAELETAEIETTSLPGGLRLKGGKFFSDFGAINAQHPHAWDFVDQPLIYQLTLGGHGLNDTGLQVSWQVPVPFHLHAGVEAFQGHHDGLFAHLDEEGLPDHRAPRASVGWLKFGPAWEGPHTLQLGVFAADGRHQEAHLEEEEPELLDGDSSFWGGEVVYAFDDEASDGAGDLVVQAEYFNRRKDLAVVADTEDAGRLLQDQDGYYAQATYGFMPRWRAGLRFEQVGLQNEIETPEGESFDLEPSQRLAAMVDYAPSSSSRIRVQANHGSYETEEGQEEVTEVYLQWMLSLGSHGVLCEGACP